VRADIDADQAAAMLFAIYTSALRDWITQEPAQIDQGRSRLEWLLAIPAAVLEQAPAR
jgi:hypothetical protein